MVEWIKFDGSKEIYTVQCPGCKKLLNSEGNDKEIIVNMITEGGSGRLHLSAIWGDYSHSIDGIFVASGEVVEMICPYCNESLKSDDICTDCGGTTTIFSHKTLTSTKTKNKGTTSESQLAYLKKLRQVNRLSERAKLAWRMNELNQAKQSIKNENKQE